MLLSFDVSRDALTLTAITRVLKAYDYELASPKPNDTNFDLFKHRDGVLPPLEYHCIEVTRRTDAEDIVRPAYLVRADYRDLPAYTLDAAIKKVWEIVEPKKEELADN